MKNLKDFKKIFKASPFPCIIFLPGNSIFTIVEINDAFLQVSGYKENNLINKSIAEAFSDLDKVEVLQSTLNQALTTRGKINAEIPLWGAKYQHAGINPVFADNGEVDYIICTILGSSDKKSPSATSSVEDKSLKFHEHYRSLFEHNPNGVFSFDLKGNFLDANESLARLAECSVEEILQKTFIGFISPEDLERVMSNFQKAAEGVPQNYEARAITAKGNTLSLNITNLPIIVNDEIVGVFGVARDITEKTKAEKLIRKSEEQLQKIMNRSLDVICTIDENGTFIKVGAACEKLWGYTPEELVGSKAINLIYKEDVEFTRQVLKDIFDTVEISNLKNRIIRKDGMPRVNVWSVRWDKSDKTYYAVARDYSEMQAAEEIIKNNEKRFKALLTNSTDGLFLLAEDETIIETSITGKKIIRLDEDDVLGKKWSDLIFPEDKPIVKQAFLTSLLTPNEADVVEHRLKMHDGSIKWLESTFHNQLNEAAVRAVVLTFWDITERKTAEMALRKSEERYYKMVEEVKDYAIILLDKDGTIENWNEGAENIHGYTPDEIIGKHFKAFYSDEDLERKIPEKLLSEAEEKGVASIEGWRIRKDGNFFWANTTVTALHEDDDRVIGFTKVTRDLTDKKRAEEELIRYAEELEASNEELEQFAYVASHDLQEPLRMVTSFLTQLERKYKDQLDDKAKQYIHFAVDGAVRMRKIILDLLEFSRIGRAAYEIEEIDMNDLVKEVVELNSTVIEEKSARIEWKNLPTIKGRRTPLQQVMLNLIGNALKYQQDNVKPEIKISATETSRHWQFAVADNGIGIEPQFYDKIFAIFQRLHNKEEYSGNGIGLAICKKIIENHKGKIWVEENAGKGSTFYFTISKQLK